MSTARQVDPGCCQCDFPDIPAHWLLFVDFAFTFGTTVVYFADIVTDIITLRKYNMLNIVINFCTFFLMSKEYKLASIFFLYCQHNQNNLVCLCHWRWSD